LTLYIDPWQIDGEPHDGDVVLISHGHYDHLSREDIRSVMKEDGRVLASEDAVKELGFGEVILPGQTVEVAGLRVTGHRAYNEAKEFHPKENNWLGFLLEMDGKKIYYAGDTDVIEESEQLQELDLLLVPVGGTFTFDAEQAAETSNRLKPRKAIPYHWGEVVGNRKDATKFAKKCEVPVEVLSPMDYLSL